MVRSRWTGPWRRSPSPRGSSGSEGRPGPGRRRLRISPADRGPVPGRPGDARRAAGMADDLPERGIRGDRFPPPGGAAPGKARLRAQLAAAHRPEQVDRAVVAFTGSARKFGIRRPPGAGPGRRRRRISPGDRGPVPGRPGNGAPASGWRTTCRSAGSGGIGFRRPVAPRRGRRASGRSWRRRTGRSRWTGRWWRSPGPRGSSGSEGRPGRDRAGGVGGAFALRLGAAAPGFRARLRRASAGSARSPEGDRAPRRGHPAFVRLPSGPPTRAQRGAGRSGKSSPGGSTDIPAAADPGEPASRYPAFP